MKFAIQINEGPFTHQAADTAYLFTKAALENGHEIFRVFFYHDGVNNGTMYGVPPQDDRNVQALWSDLAEKHDLDLVVCDLLEHFALVDFLAIKVSLPGPVFLHHLLGVLGVWVEFRPLVDGIVRL